MRPADVRIGETYLARFSGGKVYAVKVLRRHQVVRAHHLKGWDCINLITGKPLHIECARRLRRKA